MDPFKEVAAGAREALEDMIDPASWTVVFVAREDRGYRLLVAYRGEWLRTLIRGSVDVAPNPRVAARNLVGSFLDGVAKEHGQAGRRPIYEDEYVRASAFPDLPIPALMAPSPHERRSRAAGGSGRDR
jgi:hypothetical protein